MGEQSSDCQGSGLGFNFKNLKQRIRDGMMYPDCCTDYTTLCICQKVIVLYAKKSEVY